MRNIEIKKEPNGVSVCARIPLDDNGNLHCEMDLSSYHALLGMGYATKLSHTRGAGKAYPCYRHPRTTRDILIGRILAGARENQRVQFRDGNPLNLRLSNLKIV